MAESTASGTDSAWMARALRLARRGLYTTDPNPRVGCVVVRDGEVVADDAADLAAATERALADAAAVGYGAE
jgi:diaminohydroxyphosphoribosylaminopyrimidine deaminase/5-amino-6-(5-phosphoribosylamino)uracil reductase